MEMPPFLMIKIRFFDLKGSGYIPPARREDRAWLPSDLRAGITKGQSLKGSAFLFPARPELPKALNSGGVGGRPVWGQKKPSCSPEKA